MPTYEYGCEACGKSWEIEQRITEAPIKKCPKCGKQKARRLISGGTFMLKGGGWYADGYGSSKGKAAKPDGAKSETVGKADSSSKPDGGAAKADSGSKADTSSKADSGSKAESSAKAKPSSSGAADS